VRTIFIRVVGISPAIITETLQALATTAFGSTKCIRDNGAR